MGAFKIVAGWWGHQQGLNAVVGVSTEHSLKTNATILNATLSILLPEIIPTIIIQFFYKYYPLPNPAFQSISGTISLLLQ